MGPVILLVTLSRPKMHSVPSDCMEEYAVDVTSSSQTQLTYKCKAMKPQVLQGLQYIHNEFISIVVELYYIC